MITGLGHVMIRVSNFEKALGFYRDVLRLKEAFRLYDDAGKPWIIYLHVSGYNFVELSETREAPRPNPGPGFAHLCLLVDDIQAEFRRLQPTGCVITDAPKLGKDESWQFWLQDPDGNRIEMMENPAGSKQAEAVAKAAGVSR